MIRARIRETVQRARAPGWSIADQVLYSGTNFGATIVVARLLGPSGFGVFALALAVWAALWVLARSAFAEPFTIQSAGLPLDQWREDASLAAGATLAAGGVAGVVIAVGSLALPDAVRGAFLVLAVLAPVLMLQDFWRVAAFSRELGIAALINDSVWAGAQLAAFAVLWALDVISAPAVLAAWGLGALAGGAAGQAALRLRPALSGRTLAWAQRALRLGSWFGAARGIQVAAGQGVLIAVGNVAGLAALGGFRGVYSLFGPLGVILRGWQLSALPGMSRVPAKLLGRSVATSVVGLVPLAVAYGSLLVLGGGGLVGFVYGDVFEGYSELLIPVALAYTTILGTAPFILGLQRLGRGREVLGIEAGGSLLNLVLVVVFAAMAGVLGAAWALAAGGLVRGVVRGAAFLLAVREEQRRASVLVAGSCSVPGPGCEESTPKEA